MLHYLHCRIWRKIILLGLVLVLVLCGAAVNGQDTAVDGAATTDDDTEPPPGVKCNEENGECTVSVETLLPTALETGAVYETHFDFPVLGPYKVIMTVDSAASATLVVEGGFPIHDSFQYMLDKDQDAGTVRFTVVLSTWLNSVLDKYWVKLLRISYDVETDTPSVVVKIAAIITFPLKLHRVVKNAGRLRGS